MTVDMHVAMHFCAIAIGRPVLNHTISDVQQQCSKGAFGSRFWANQAHGVQASGVWLPAPPPESGSPDAISLLLPASPETPETAVFAEPGSARAIVSLTNDVLVYN
jgi:hypothetical protein